MNVITFSNDSFVIILAALTHQLLLLATVSV